MYSDNHFLYTVIGALICALAGAFCFWRGNRPHEGLKPRLVPWNFIAFGFIAFGFVLVVHIVNLLGFETGRR